MPTLLSSQCRHKQPVANAIVIRINGLGQDRAARVTPDRRRPILHRGNFGCSLASTLRAGRCTHRNPDLPAWSPWRDTRVTPRCDDRSDSGRGLRTPGLTLDQGLGRHAQSVYAHIARAASPSTNASPPEKPIGAPSARQHAAPRRRPLSPSRMMPFIPPATLNGVST